MATMKDIMKKEVVTINRDATMQETSQILIKNKLSGIPVVDKKKSLVGFVSERDIITAMSTGISLDVKVKDVMVKNVVSVKENTSVEQVSQVFTAHPFRYIPVTKKKKIIGIISRKDVIETLLGQYY